MQRAKAKGAPCTVVRIERDAQGLRVFGAVVVGGRVVESADAEARSLRDAYRKGNALYALLAPGAQACNAGPTALAMPERVRVVRPRFA